MILMFFLFVSFSCTKAYDIMSPEMEDELINKANVSKSVLNKYKLFLKLADQVGYQAFFKTPRPEIIHITINDPTVNQSKPEGEYNSQLFEGDMLLGNNDLDKGINKLQAELKLRDEPAEKNDDPDKNEKQRAAITSHEDTRWRFPIIYKIGSGVNEQAVQSAVKLWESNTCVKFQKSSNPSGNYINIISGSGCYSSVGTVGGAQGMSLGNGCGYTGIAAHEFGHALGLWHEQSRSDRDSNVFINAQNIQSGLLGNFMKLDKNDMAYGNIVPYDFGSIMHYGPTSFVNSDNVYSMSSLNPWYQNTMGQRDMLSFNDIRAINVVYCSEVCNQDLPCKHGGYTDPKNCNRCRCPEGFSGTYCDQASDTSTDCGEISLDASDSWQTLTQLGSGNCNWMIKSDPGTKIQLDFSASSFKCSTTCSPNNGYVEVRYKGDLSNTGPRLCCVKPNNVVSDGSDVLIIYIGKSASYLSVRYKQAGISNAKTTIRSKPTTTTARTTTTRTTTTRTTIPLEPFWSAWSEWTHCSDDCGACGRRLRSRVCSTKDCKGNRSQSQVCHNEVCEGSVPCCEPYVAVNGLCALGSPMTTTTIGVVKTTTREVNPTTAPFPSPTSSEGWTDWSDWTGCMGGDGCGGCSKRTRSRSCPTNDCQGPSNEATPCFLQPCTSCETRRVFTKCPNNPDKLCVIATAVDPNASNCPCCSPYQAINYVCQ